MMSASQLLGSTNHLSRRLMKASWREDEDIVAKREADCICPSVGETEHGHTQYKSHLPLDLSYSKGRETRPALPAVAATPMKEKSLETMISTKDQSDAERLLDPTEEGHEIPKEQLWTVRGDPWTIVSRGHPS